MSVDVAENLVPGLGASYRYSYTLPIEIQDKTFSRMATLVRGKVAPFRFRLAAGEIVNELGIKSEQRVLELGSGLGLLGEAVKEKVGAQVSYVGVDLFYRSAKAGSEKSLIGVQANIARLPFANDSFDTIISTDVLEHVVDAPTTVAEIFRVLKPGGRAFLVIADPSEARFGEIPDHIRRTRDKTDVWYWENLFQEEGFEFLPNRSKKYRKKDWRRIFNLPFLVKLKNRPGFACAFNPVNRPGVYIVKKPG